MSKIQEKYAELNDRHNACVTEMIALRKEVEWLRLVAKRAYLLEEDNRKLRAELAQAIRQQNQGYTLKAVQEALIGQE